MSPALAGEIRVVWERVPDSKLTGYRIYYGTSRRSYTKFVDVAADATGHTLQGLNDCQIYHVALKSLDDNRRESAEFSSEIVGFTQPRILSVRPDLALVGAEQTLEIEGSSFEAGATLVFDNPDVVVMATSVPSCDRMQVTLRLRPGAEAEDLPFRVINTGGVPSKSVLGLGVATEPGPRIKDWLPEDGAVEVSPGIVPEINFDAPVDAGSLSTSGVALVDEQGNLVPLVGGAPTVNGSKVFFIPAVPFRQGGRYSLHVFGGRQGVRGIDGAPAVYGRSQRIGFLIANPPPSVVPGIERRQDPPN